jgi:hypothetical protein
MIAIGLLFARILCDMNPTPHLALQHDQLMPERGIICLKSAFRPEECGNQAQEEKYQCGAPTVTVIKSCGRGFWYCRFRKPCPIDSRSPANQNMIAA